MKKYLMFIITMMWMEVSLMIALIAEAVIAILFINMML